MNLINEYKDLKKEVINKVKEMYNLLPEEAKEYLGSGLEIAGDISNFFKVVKFFNSFKERFLVKKIENFFKDINEIPIEKINKLVEKCEISKEKFTEHLIVIIDRLESEEKINYFSKLFILFATTDMDKQLYFRCCKILENYSYYDLSSFVEKEVYSIECNEDAIAFSMGLLQYKPVVAGEIMSAKDSNELILNEAGKIFQKLNK